MLKESTTGLKEAHLSQAELWKAEREHHAHLTIITSTQNTAQNN